MSYRKISLLVWLSFLDFTLGEIVAGSCEQLSTENSNYCLACGEGFYRLNEEPLNTKPFPISECLPKINSSSDLEVFISEKECLETSFCNGSLEDPFDNLLFALDTISNKTKMYYRANVKIFLLGVEIFILQKDVKTAVKYYFRNSLMSLSISPYPCSRKKVLGCREVGESIKINIKTNEFLFFVSSVLSISNLIFTGIDMPLENYYTYPSSFPYTYSCYQQKLTCCLQEKFRGAIFENDSICTANPGQTNILVNKLNFYGLFNTETMIFGRNLTELPFPKIILENCTFEHLSTLFPTNAPRFSTLFQFMDTKVDISLKNIIITGCFFADGLLKQTLPLDSNIEDTGIFYSRLSIINASFSSIGSINYLKRSKNPLIFIENFRGEIFIKMISLLETVDSAMLFLSFTNVGPTIEITDINFARNDGVGFLYCSSCQILKISDVILKNSNFKLIEEKLFINIKYSESIYISRMAIQDFYFIKNGTSKVPALAIAHVSTALDVNEIYFERIECLSISIHSLILKLKTLVVNEMSTDYRLLSSKNCSVFFQEILITYIETRFKFLISLESDEEGSNYVLLVLDGHFSNILFFMDDWDNRVFDWPLFTYSDSMLMKNISVFNCTHDMIWQYVTFFCTYWFARLDIENAEFSYHKQGRNSLLWLGDVPEVRLNNIKFRNNERADYYLVVVYCENCKVFASNIYVEGASITLAWFFFESYLGNFENFTITEVWAIFPSILFGEDNSKFGLILFHSFFSCLLRNWLFRSSEVLKYSPSYFFEFAYNTNTRLENINLQLPDSPIILPETHIIISRYNEYITINKLSTRNLLCQRSVYGKTSYQVGLLSFFNSETFLKEVKNRGTLLLYDISVFNCRFCKNGVIGIVNLRTVSFKNISIYFTENIYGGAIAIFYGTIISIKNLRVISSYASQYGGAVYSIGTANLEIVNTLLYDTQAQLGGAFYVRDVTDLKLSSFTLIKSSALSGGVIYALNTNLKLNSGYASDYQALKDGGCIYIRRGKVQLHGGFLGELGQAEQGGFIFSYEVEELVFEDIYIKNSSATEKGVSFLIEDCNRLNASNITLFDLKSESGFGNIYLIIRSQAVAYEMTNIVCKRVSMLASVLIYLENGLNLKKTLNITVTNVLILEGLGSVAFFKSSYVSKVHAFILKNITVSDFNNKILLSNHLKEIPAYSLAFYSTYSVLENFTFINVTFIANCLVFADSDIYLENFLFQATDDTHLGQKIILLISALNSNASLIKLFFSGDKSSYTAMVSSENSFLSLKQGSLWRCLTYPTFCIESFKSTILIQFFIFLENTAILKSRNSRLMIENTTFKGYTSSFKLEKSLYNIQTTKIDIFAENGEASYIKNTYFFELNDGTSLTAKNSKLKIFTCVFLAQTSTENKNQGRAIWGSNSEIEILNSTFLNYLSENGGTIRIENHQISNENKNFVLAQSIISNSRSDYGGAFSLFGFMNGNISQNIFFNNRALKNQFGEYGNFGVGVFICNFCENTSLSLINNKFISNYAENGLATVFSNSIVQTSPSDYIFYEYKFSQDTNSYYNNSDGMKTLLDLSFLPFKISIFLNLTPRNHSKLMEININDTISFQSGQSFDLKIILSDYKGQAISLDHLSSSHFSDSFKNDLLFFMIANKISYSEKAEFSFQNLLIKADLSKSFELLLNFGLVSDYLYPQDRGFINIKPLSLKFYSEPCEVGEIVIYGDSSCLRCPPGKYSLLDPMKVLNNSDFKCLDCPANAICSGGATITPQKGYWRNSSSSSLIVECLSRFSCLGLDDGQLNENEFIHGKCLKHSYGPICYLCERGFGRFSKTGTCRKCSAEFQSYLMLSLMIAVYVTYTLIQIKLNFRFSKTSKTEVLLKIIVNHFQQISIISLDFGWTHDLEALLTFKDIFSYLSNEYLPLDCILQNIGYNLQILNVIGTNIFPIVLLVLSTFSWVVYRKFRPPKFPSSDKKWYQILQITFYIVTILLFPEVIRKNMSLFTCQNLDDTIKIKVVLYSPEVICWSDEHISYLIYAATPGLIMWGITAPFLISYFLAKNKSLIMKINEERKSIGDSTFLGRLNKVKAFQIEKIVHLKFLFKGYSSKYFYWELFMFLKKFLLIIVGYFSDLLPGDARGIFLLLAISFFLIVQLRYNPFESATFNRLEAFSMITFFFTTHITILMLSKNFLELTKPLLIILLLINASFLLYWLKIFFIEGIGHHKYIRTIGVFLGKRKRRNRILDSSVQQTRAMNFRNPNNFIGSDIKS